MLHVGDSLNFPFSFTLSKDFSNYSLSSSAMITPLQTQVPHLTLQMQCIRQHCTCSYIYSNPFFILSSKNRPQTTSYNINEGAWGYKTRRARGQNEYHHNELSQYNILREAAPSPPPVFFSTTYYLEAYAHVEESAARAPGHLTSREAARVSRSSILTKRCISPKQQLL